MPDSLIKINRSDWPQLRDLYLNRKHHASAYNLIQNYINWITQNSELDVNIFSLNGEWQQDGLFLVNDHSNIYTNILSDNLDRLTDALNCLDTTKEYLICGFQKRILPSVINHFQLKTIVPAGTVWYHISREKVEQFNCKPPTGINIGKLELQHAEQVNRIWPHRTPGSVEFVKRLILYNDTVGAFDDDGNLVAWVLILPLGSMGLLQVEDTHKRKGLGSLVVRCMAKTILSQNTEVLAPVVFGNFASRSLFENLEFQPIDYVYWVAKRNDSN